MIPFAMACLGVSILGALYRVWKGPTPIDRLLAADFISLPVAGFLVLWGTLYPESHAKDIALLVVIAGFVGVVFAAPRLRRRRA